MCRNFKAWLAFRDGQRSEERQEGEQRAGGVRGAALAGNQAVVVQASAGIRRWGVSYSRTGLCEPGEQIGVITPRSSEKATG